MITISNYMLELVNEWYLEPKVIGLLSIMGFIGLVIDFIIQMLFVI